MVERGPVCRSSPGNIKVVQRQLSFSEALFGDLILFATVQLRLPTDLRTNLLCSNTKDIVVSGIHLEPQALFKGCHLLSWTLIELNSAEEQKNKRPGWEGHMASNSFGSEHLFFFYFVIDLAARQGEEFG